MSGFETSLADVVGPAFVRPGDVGDAVDGLIPNWVVEPGSVEEVSQVLVLAHGQGLAVLPRGSGRRMGLGDRPRKGDLLLSTQRLNRILEYEPGDLVLRAEAGARLSAVAEVTGRNGQMLAIDPVFGDGTLGGIMATRDAGSNQMRYGGIRDLAIGLTYVLADGTVARAGGKVVKNVAGYDLCKLFTGSLGSLGLIAEVTFRLHPLPAVSGTLVASLKPGALSDAVRLVTRSMLVPTRLVATWDDGSTVLGMQFQGVEAGVRAQMAQGDALLKDSGLCVSVDEGQEDFWRRPHVLAEREAVVRISVPLVEMSRIMDLARGCGAEVEQWCDVGIGRIVMGMTGASEDIGTSVEMLRQACAGKNVVIWKAPTKVKERLVTWGEVPALELMRRVKARFDPDGIMNPGRYVGGL